MEKQTIIRELMAKGIMVTPDILEMALRDGIDQVVSSRHDVVMSSVRTTERTRNAAEPIKCSSLLSESKKEYTIEDAVKSNYRRYESLRRMLLRKADAVSIKNITNAKSRITVVGMVKEKKDFGFVLEDSTGEATVKSDANVETDDVIGVNGWVRNGVFTADDVFYPDIPMDRVVGTIEGTLLLKNTGSIPDVNADVTVTPDSFITGGKEAMTCTPNTITVERGGKKLIIVVYKTDDPVNKNDAIRWLRRRFMPSSERIFDSMYVLDPVPDILWISSKNDYWCDNYKGTTMVSFGYGRSALVDMKTRGIKQL